ncbi:MAG: HtaA domain-containing protein [Actinomycetota bacterium]|nr:HtaA domain-containing protein [Actinomycetota bacterium]
MKAGATSVGNSPVTARKVPFGLVLVVAGVLAVLSLWIAPVPADAAELVPCGVVPPKGPVVEIDGEATIVAGKVLKTVKRKGVRARLIKPANNLTGWPAYPVKTVNYGKRVSRIGLGGGFRLRKGKRQLQFRGLKVVIRGGGKAFVNARFGGGLKRLFIVKKGRVVRNAETGELNLIRGNATLSAPAAKLIRKRFGLKRVKTIRKERSWGRLDLYSLYRVTLPPTNPEGEAPAEPPVLIKPAGADNVTSATINWRVRDSFIRYVNSGSGANAIDGAIPGTPEGSPPLVYNFTFPFTSGWVDETSSLIKGSGGVTFRFCRHTINFMVQDPEVELNGDSSRLIFRVKGTDGSAYPDSRAVTVDLKLSGAQKVETVGKTTTYTGIPGFVPTGSTGLFADIYAPGDEFGHLDLTVTTE